MRRLTLLQQVQWPLMRVLMLRRRVPWRLMQVLTLLLPALPLPAHQPRLPVTTLWPLLLHLLALLPRG
jgi:hypothetical protein